MNQQVILLWKEFQKCIYYENGRILVGTGREGVGPEYKKACAKIHWLRGCGGPRSGHVNLLGVSPSLKYTSSQIALLSRGNFTCPNNAFLQPGDLNYPSFAVLLDKNGPSTSVTYKRTVTNVGTRMSTYVVQVDEPNGVSVTVEPKSLKFENLGEKLSYNVREYRSWCGGERKRPAGEESRQQRSGEKETGPSPEQRRSGDRGERDRSVNGGIARKRPAGEENRQQRSGEKETGPSPEQRRSGDRGERDRSVNGGISSPQRERIARERESR
uniref:Subtilisin-like protease fibronectin type-III domain-containing protein n=1 Tax=Fagus sylvatica TaxID=28930 RepID=A0A2N9FN16_FAGSY